MDTRKKIVKPADLPGLPGTAHVARGWFDVLTAEHCAILASAKPADGPLVVIVYRESAERPTPLNAYDRAQMIAALACVDLVCVCDPSRARTVTDSLAPASETDVDALQTRDVVSDVLAAHPNG